MSTNLSKLSNNSNFNFQTKAVEFAITIDRNGEKEYHKSQSMLIYPEDLHNFMPLGASPSYYAGYVFINNSSYFSVFSRNKGLNINVIFDKNKHPHPILLLDTSSNKIYEYLEHVHHNDSNLELSLNTLINYDRLKMIDNLDKLIYSILIKKKIRVLGNRADAIDVMRSVIMLIPPHLRTNIGFAFNISNFQHESVTFYFNDNKSEIDIDNIKEEFDILDLNSNNFHSINFSEYTNIFLKLIKQENTYEIHELFNEIVFMADKYKKLEANLEEEEFEDLTNDDFKLLELVHCFN